MFTVAYRYTPVADTGLFKISHSDFSHSGSVVGVEGQTYGLIEQLIKA